MSENIGKFMDKEGNEMYVTAMFGLGGNAIQLTTTTKDETAFIQLSEAQQNRLIQIIMARRLDNDYSSTGCNLIDWDENQYDVNGQIQEE